MAISLRGVLISLFLLTSPVCAQTDSSASLAAKFGDLAEKLNAEQPRILRQGRKEDIVKCAGAAEQANLNQILALRLDTAGLPEIREERVARLKSRLERLKGILAQCQEQAI